MGAVSSLSKINITIVDSSKLPCKHDGDHHFISACKMCGKSVCFNCADITSLGHCCKQCVSPCDGCGQTYDFAHLKRCTSCNAEVCSSGYSVGIQSGFSFYFGRLPCQSTTCSKKFFHSTFTNLGPLSCRKRGHDVKFYPASKRRNVNCIACIFDLDFGVVTASADLCPICSRIFRQFGCCPECEYAVSSVLSQYIDRKDITNVLSFCGAGFARNAHQIIVDDSGAFDLDDVIVWDIANFDKMQKTRRAEESIVTFFNSKQTQGRLTLLTNREIHLFFQNPAFHRRVVSLEENVYMYVRSLNQKRSEHLFPNAEFTLKQ